MKTKSDKKLISNEIDEAGNTIVKIGRYRDNPQRLSDIVAKNNERDIKFLNFFVTSMPIYKDDFEMIELKDKIKIFLDSKGLL